MKLFGLFLLLSHFNTNTTNTNTNTNTPNNNTENIDFT